MDCHYSEICEIYYGQKVCHAIQVYGEPCDHIRECLVTDPNANCSNSRCSCTEKYYYSSEAERCVENGTQFGKLRGKELNFNNLGILFGMSLLIVIFMIIRLRLVMRVSGEARRKNSLATNSKLTSQTFSSTQIKNELRVYSSRHYSISLPN